MHDPLIKVANVSKSYASKSDAHLALSHLTFSVDPGERISLVGANGSGKTTLLRMLIGAEDPDEGSVSRAYGESRGKVSYIPQDYRSALFPWLSLSANLGLALQREAPRGDIVAVPTEDSEEFLARCADFGMSIDLEKFPYQLSGGEQQVFLLIRALMAQPVLLIMDEALSAVDYGRKQRIQGHLGQRLLDNHTTTILASHDFEEAVMLADRVLVLDRRRDGHIALPVDLPWPRHSRMRDSASFRAVVAAIVALML